MTRRYFLETLGCPKNAVDSAKLAGTLVADGYEETADPGAADLVVVNTCAFIEAARAESIETIIALGEALRPGARLVVIGICFSDQLLDEVPRAGTDQAVDGVVTESETLLFDRTGLIQ